MIFSFYYSDHGSIQYNLSMEQIREAFQSKSGLLWVHLSHPDPIEANQILSDIFQFHPLTIEDCLNTGYQTPKVDDFLSYIFMILHAVQLPDHASDEINTGELNAYLGSHFLVTLHLEEQMAPIQTVIQRIEKDERIYKQGADFLCYSILDALVDEYVPILDQMDEEIDKLEDAILQKPRPETLERIINLKHNIAAIRRIIGPQRELVNRLSRDTYAVITQHSKIYFRDVYDHLIRFQDLSESIRDIISSALDIYLSSTSLRLDHVMKALTLVSTIFLPLTFIAGIYGMNFKYMPELSWRFGYPLVWVVCISISAGMVYYFRKKNWL